MFIQPLRDSQFKCCGNRSHALLSSTSGRRLVNDLKLVLTEPVLSHNTDRISITLIKVCCSLVYQMNLLYHQIFIVS